MPWGYHLSGGLQLFGGDWTEQKLSMLAKYLAAYTTALKNKRHFRKVYFDAFAGTGYREERENTSTSDKSLFPELGSDEPQRFRAGSAKIALSTIPRFDSYAFIESSSRRVRDLELLKREFPDFAKDIHICLGDANQQLQAWCQKTDWQHWRGVLFLDPYGMQVEWKTVEAVASTRAIDVWILFPVGIGANRMLTRNLHKMDESWRRRLDSVFGTADWQRTFYKKVEEAKMFDVDTSTQYVKVATFESIGQFYHERLKTIFPCVADNPRDLCNSTGSPLYQLHFAAGNPRGGPIALRIAQSILKNT